jgi:hypothetical protein
LVTGEPNLPSHAAVQQHMKIVKTVENLSSKEKDLLKRSSVNTCGFSKPLEAGDVAKGVGYSTV